MGKDSGGEYLCSKKPAATLILGSHYYSLHRLDSQDVIAKLSAKSRFQIVRFPQRIPN